MKKLFKRSVWTLLTVFFTFLLAISLVVQQIAASYTSWIDDYFGAVRYRLVEDSGASGADAQYFVSPFSTRDETGAPVPDDQAMRAHALDVAERVAEEGAVLLWNRNGALPLAAGEKIAALGVASADWQYHGTGSGEVVMAVPPDLRTSLESRGFQVNRDILAIMERYSQGGYGVGSGEVPWDTLDHTPMGSMADLLSKCGDTAVFTVARTSGEGFDINADMLALRDDERSILEGLARLKAEGVVKKIILLFNTPYALSLRGFMEYDIDACLWVGYGGASATDAVADLLAGNAVPSGRLTDTWVYDVSSAPSGQNMGDCTFQQGSGLPTDDGSYQYRSVSNKYVVYLEGIYVGYRYYETRYEDSVLGGRNAGSAAGSTTGGNWSYADEVAYPFGWGASYTTFAYSGFMARKADGAYQVTVTVRNTGAYSGKEAVQVYLQKPYTDYDVRTGVEKAAVELVGFAKTDLLGPGESQTVTISVPEYEFKSYDSYGYKTYILEKGDYYLAVGTDAHDALNNILAAKGYSTADGMDGDGDSSLVCHASYDRDDVTTWSVSPFTGNPITNQFDDADVNLYEGLSGQTVTYLSRSDWENTWPATAVLSVRGNEKLIADMQYGAQLPSDPEDEMPLYGTVTSPYGHLNLIQLMDVPYSDPLWEDLLNQLTFSEQVDLTRSTLPGVASIAAPNGGGQDGPCGLNRHDPERGIPFPCDPLVASTFNVDLIEELGNVFGLVFLHDGNYAGVWGPGANIHRNAACGRTWEYYSEDGFLSGKISAAEIRGLRGVGIVPFTKHFALNEQEQHRFGLAVWANEQSIRELYLKAFEGGITEGGGNGLMTSYSRIGCTWTGRHYGLLTGVLRNEWGFLGVTVTDWPGAVYMGASSSVSGAVDSIFPCAVIAGQDMWLTNVVGSNMDGYADDPTFCLALRETAHRALYTLLHSKAMNGVSSSTQVVTVTPLWEGILVGVIVGSGILTAACLAMTLASWAVWARAKKHGNTPKGIKNQ